MFFSIIIPVYNGEKYISRCIKSVLAQTVTDFELILVENNSKDNSASLLLDWAVKDKRIKVVFSKAIGVSNARNAGLDIASGEVVCFIDIDDEIKLNYLETIYDEFVSHPEISAVLFNYEVVQENGKTILPCKVPYEKKFCGKVACEMFFDGAKEIRGYVWNKAIRRKEIELHHARFDSSISMAEDLDFCSRLFYSFSFVAFIEEPIYTYWRHQSSSSQQCVGSDKLLAQPSKLSFDLIVCSRSLALYFADLEGISGNVAVAAYLNYSYVLSIFTLSLFLLDDMRFEMFRREFCGMYSFFKENYAEKYRSRQLKLRIVNLVIKKKLFRRLIVTLLHMISWREKVKLTENSLFQPR